MTEKILTVDINEAFKEKFLTYAKKVIIDRSLPDITGMKPVHRRILWSMNQLKVTPDSKMVKSARIVGDVIGKYHPHGDSSVYEAAVRLASPYEMRYPLISPEGNFGGIDGSGAAAMRYTLMRLSPYATYMLNGIKENAVNMVSTYEEDETREPSILPGLLPNALINGNSGIAVGIAGSFLPHNLTEVGQAIMATLDNADITTEGLMEYIKGPDFPLGGTVINQKDLFEAYDTGRSAETIKVRGDYVVEGKDIIFTSIPYGTNTTKIMEQLSKQVDNDIQLKIKDIENGTAEHVKIKFTVFKETDIPYVLNWLFKKTDLQKGIGINMNLVVGEGLQEEASLKQIINLYIAHQVEIVTRTTQFKKDKALAREHILEGLLIALANIDEIVALIRASKSAADALKQLVANYNLSEIQGKAILDMKLSRLTNIEEVEVKNEHEKVLSVIEGCNAILLNESTKKNHLKGLIQAMINDIGDERRTKIDNIAVVNLTAAKAKVVVPATPVRIGFAKDSGNIKIIKASMPNSIIIDTKLNSTLVFFTRNGMAYKVKVDSLSENMQNISNLFKMAKSDEVVGVAALDEFDNIVFVTEGGMIKKTAMTEFASTREVAALKLKEQDKLLYVGDASKQYITLKTTDSKSLTFDMSGVGVTGRAGIGVIGVKLSTSAKVSSADVSSTADLKTLGKRAQVAKK